MMSFRFGLRHGELTRVFISFKVGVYSLSIFLVVISRINALSLDFMEK